MAQVPTAVLGGVSRPVLTRVEPALIGKRRIAVSAGSATAPLDVPLPEALRDLPLCVFPSMVEGTGERPLAPRLLDPGEARLTLSLPVERAATARALQVVVRGRAAHDAPYLTPAVAIPPRARLRFGLGIAASTDAATAPPAATFTVTAVTEGAEDRLFSEHLVAADTPDARAWREDEIDLAAYAGRSVRLRFESTLENASPCTIVPLWADPTIVSARPARAEEPRRRSLLLVSLDTLRADRLGCYGYARPTSPTIDARLAARGTLFEHAYAAFPSTTASHMTMLTSLDPCVHRVLHPSMLPLRADAHPLAEYLRAAGYETAAFTEDTYLLAQNGFARGFGTYVENTSVNTEGFVEKTFAEAREWIRAHRTGAPWFVFVHTYQVHAPYTPPPGYRERIGAPDDPSGSYDGEIRYTDDVLAQFLDALTPLGLDTDVLLVLASDHGEQFGEHGLVDHGNSLFDVLLHVPLVLYAPGLVPAGQRIAAPVGLVDLVPTVLDLLGLPPPSPAQGRSVAPLVRGAPLDPAPLYAGPLGSLIAARVGDAKWLIDRGADTAVVYQTLLDPAEERDIGASMPAEQRAQIFSAYARHCAALPPGTPSAGPDGSAAPTTLEIPPAVREKLRALGYAN